MHVELGSFGKTTKVDTTSSDAVFTNTSARTRFIVRASVNTHIRLNGVATVDDFLLLEETYAVVLIAPNATLHAIVANGETDGDLFITEA